MENLPWRNYLELSLLLPKLRFTGEKEKGDEMMAIFDEMLENNTDKKKIKLQPTILLKTIIMKNNILFYITIISVFH
jgi:hypothetical protein